MTAAATEKSIVPVRRWAFDIVMVLVLIGASIVGFWPSFAGPS